MRSVSTVLSSTFRLSVLIAVSVGLVGCATTNGLRTPVPQELAKTATITNSHGDNVRHWGETGLEETDAATKKILHSNAKILLQTQKLDYLTLSGGGFNGAYGVGFLRGWTQSGKRPEFEVVTGISVGALIAPMAFLGSEYDEHLTAAFRMITGTASTGPGVLGLLLGADSLESNASIQRAITTIITPEIVEKIAAAHKTGRRLLVGTTNLDAERPIIWDIGAIATSDIPEKIDLIRKILLASAALPGVYPPVLFEVEAEGKKYEELHVDGGVSQQIVLLPDNLNLHEFDRQFGNSQLRNLYVIFNGQLTPSYQPVKAGGLSLLLRTLPAFIKNLGIGDVTMLRNSAKRNGMNFKLTALPEDIQVDNDIRPDKEYLNEIMQLGYKHGSTRAWID